MLLLPSIENRALLSEESRESLSNDWHSILAPERTVLKNELKEYGKAVADFWTTKLGAMESDSDSDQEEERTKEE